MIKECFFLRNEYMCDQKITFKLILPTHGKHLRTITSSENEEMLRQLENPSEKVHTNRFESN